ncbi:MAG: hypothetical protein V7767_08445 [Leeuwenhoekiella sp.]
MSTPNKIFLFGAGSIIDWGGPLTSELTDHIRQIGYPIKNSNQKLTDYIYQTLLDNGFEESEVNFETIISVIEELAIYFSEFNAKNQTPSLLRNFLNDSELNKILDFSIKGGERKHGYKLDIPENIEYHFSNLAYNNENPIQFYLQHLLSEIISEISAFISDYSYHTKDHSVIKVDSKNSKNFTKWMSQYNTKNNLRLYTLNYDRVFKILLEYGNIDCFEGFYVSGEVSDLDGLRCDIKRIIKDEDLNVHYNLHGSAYWRVIPSNNSQLPSPELVYVGFPHLQINDEIANVQIEKGKPIFLTNIISGYQKAQKSMISPFKQMHFSFDRDCLSSDKIFIVGYSFSDEHINQCLKTALRYNDKLKVEIIEPNFIKNKMDYHLSLSLFQYIEGDFLRPKKISENEFSYVNGRIKVYTLKFKEYLELKSSS